MASTEQTINWLDAFEATVEAMAETLADKKKLEGMTKTKFLGSSFNVEAYRERKRLWRQVRKKFISFGLECSEDLTFEGAMQKPVGVGGGMEWVMVAADLKVYHTEESQIPVVFPGDEAQCAMNFIAFFLESLSKGVDPSQYVKSVLMAQGITSSEQFEANREKFHISNPWKD
jgi:hypothetical protein